MSVPSHKSHSSAREATRNDPAEMVVAGALSGLVSQAVLLLADAAGCSVMARQADGSSTTLAHHGPIAMALDALQHDLGTGPSLAAIEEGREITVPHLADETRWQPFPGRASKEAGARFAVALPLTRSGANAALTVYGTTACELEPLLGRARPLAVQAGAILRLAHDAEQARATLQDMNRAMSTRAVIDQAIGILMAQQHCSADRAFAILRRASQNRNVKLRTLCQDIVAGVTSANGSGSGASD